MDIKAGTFDKSKYNLPAETMHMLEREALEEAERRNADEGYKQIYAMAGGNPTVALSLLGRPDVQAKLPGGYATATKLFSFFNAQEAQNLQREAIAKAEQRENMLAQAYVWAYDEQDQQGSLMKLHRMIEDPATPRVVKADVVRLIKGREAETSQELLQDVLGRIDSGEITRPGQLYGFGLKKNQVDYAQKYFHQVVTLENQAALKQIEDTFDAKFQKWGDNQAEKKDHRDLFMSLLRSAIVNEGLRGPAIYERANAIMSTFKDDYRQGAFSPELKRGLMGFGSVKTPAVAYSPILNQYVPQSQQQAIIDALKRNSPGREVTADEVINTYQLLNKGKYGKSNLATGKIERAK